MLYKIKQVMCKDKINKVKKKNNLGIIVIKLTNAILFLE